MAEERIVEGIGCSLCGKRIGDLPLTRISPGHLSSVGQKPVFNEAGQKPCSKSKDGKHKPVIMN